MRVVFGCIAAVFVGFFVGLIMGEYELLGVMAIVAGVLFGLAVAEVSITVGKSNDWTLVAVTALSGFFGMTWAAYIDAGDSLGRIAGIRWVAALLAAAERRLVGQKPWVKSTAQSDLRRICMTLPASSVSMACATAAWPS